jgi:hypothetical protein
MSIGPMSGFVGAAGAAGAPLAQTKGADVDRAPQDTAAAELQIQGEQRAETAAGIGETDGQDHQTAERDADGRRLWERAAKPAQPEDAEKTAEDLHGKDPTGASGNLLDLSG